MGTGMIDNQRFSGINIQILKVCNYNLDEIDSFIEQFKDFRNEIKQKDILSKYEKITNTQTLINELNKLNEYDLDTLENIAYRIEMDNRYYNSALRDCLLEDIETIKFNNLEKTSKFNVILDVLIQQVEDIAIDYAIKPEEKEEIEQ